MIKTKYLIPTEAPHPGKLILSMMKERKVNQITLCRQLGIHQVQLSGVINGNRPVRPSLAIKLAVRFDTSPIFWLTAQANYDLNLAKLKIHKEQQATRRKERAERNGVAITIKK